MNSSRRPPFESYPRSAYLAFHALDALLLAFVAASILAYPVPAPGGNLKWSALYSSPLPLKENLSLVFGFLVVSLYMTRSILMGRFEYLRTPYNPLMGAGIAAVLVFSALSSAGLLAWRDALLTLTHLAFFFVLCARTKDRRFRRLLYFVLGACTFLAALVALLQVHRETFATVWPLNRYVLPYLIQSEGERTFMASTIGHNISVASFFMLMVFHLLGLAIAYRPKEGRFRLGWLRNPEHRRWLVFGSLGLLILLNTYLIVQSMTRAVWLTYPLCLFLFLFLLLGLRRRLRESRRSMLAWGVAAAVGLSVTILASVAFNYEAVSARLDTFTYDVLIQNTRARLNAVGLEMIRHRPLLGHGFAGFKHQYPEYQRAFFEHYPDSQLAPTHLHTDRAHNEFLQIWIEFGVAGLLVALYFLALHFYYAWRVLFRWRNDQKTILFLAAFVATVGVLMQNTISFEFHVQSSVTVFLTSLALMCGLDGKTRIREVPLTQLSTTEPLRVLLSVACLLIAFGGALVPARWSMGESAYYVAEELKRRAISDAARGDQNSWQVNISRALVGLEMSVRFAPYYGMYHFNLGQVQMQMAASNLPHPKTGEPITYEDARETFREAMETWQFKDLSYFMAQALLARMSSPGAPQDPDERAALREEALWHMRMAAGINPHDWEMRYRLAMMHVFFGQPSEAVAELKKVRDRAPEALQEKLKSEAFRYSRQGQEQMVQALEELAYAVYPEVWDFVFPQAVNYAESNNGEAALRILHEYHEREPEDNRTVRGVAEVYRLLGETDKSIETLLAPIEGVDINRDVALWLVYVDDFYRDVGRGSELPAFWAEQLRTREILGPNARSIVLMRTGRLALAEGDLDAARSRFQEAYDLNRGMERGLGYRETLDSAVLLPFLLTQ